MPKSLRIDFVSDVVCPWCAIGLASLEQALRQLQGEVAADLHVQPFVAYPKRVGSTVYAQPSMGNLSPCSRAQSLAIS